MTGRLHPLFEAAGEARLCTRWRSSRTIRHERPYALSTLNQALVLEFPIGLHHSVGIDGHLGHHFLDGGELVAHVEDPHAHGLLDLLHQLQVRRHAGVGAELEADRLPQYFSSHLENSTSTEKFVNAGKAWPGPAWPGPACPGPVRS